MAEEEEVVNSRLLWAKLVRSRGGGGGCKFTLLASGAYPLRIKWCRRGRGGGIYGPQVGVQSLLQCAEFWKSVMFCMK